VLGIAVVALWQAAVSALDIPPVVVPGPSAIWGQLTEQRGLIADATLATGWNALRGLLLGAVVALLGALVAFSVRFLREMVAPIVVAASVVPIVALAPVLNGLFGSMFHTARILIAAVAVAVPVYVNTLRGLQQVKPVHRELMRAYSVPTWRQHRIVTMPTALPYLFTGLRIGSSLAVISALIAEYFGGPKVGLGSAITDAATRGNYPLAWAAVLGSIVLGLTFYLATSAAERWFTRHQPTH
jgi:NitT/TauT family transport system permease protein